MAFARLERAVARWTTGPHPVAPGVWWVGRNPGRLRVYLIRGRDGGIALFDAGGAMMLPGVRRALEQVGPLDRIVLGHAHTDHRGAASGLGAPVYCHADEVADTEGSGGFRYWGEGLPKL
ncbi:MAG: MBL fold metallo-hydrolase, partial [Gaiellaceae bacterium]